MKRRIFALAMALLVACSFPSAIHAAAYEPADVKVTLDGLLKRLGVQPVFVEGCVMVSLREITSMLNGTTEWNDDTKKVNVKMRGVVAEFKVGSKEAVVNYLDVVMPVAPVIVDGNVMVPLQFISEKFGLRVDWNEEKRLAELSSNKGKYSVLGARPQTDPGTNGISFTFEQAVNKINENNSSLRNMEDTLVVLRRNSKELSDYIAKYITPLYNGYLNIYTQEEVNYFRQERQLGNQYKSMELNKRQIMESAVVQLTNALCEIQKTDYDIYMLEEKIKLDETNLQNMKLKLSLGMEAQTNITSLENTVAKNKISLNNLKIKLKDNNLSLNKLVGVDAEKTVIITNFKYDSISYNDDVDAYVKQQLENAPTVLAKELDYEYAYFERLSYDDYLKKELKAKDGSNGGKPLVEIEMDNKKQSATRAVEDTKTALEQKIRSAYNSIKQLEISYESLKVDYETAKTNYENGVMNYVAGYVTAFDVQQLQLGLLNAEVAFITNRINLKVLTESYRYPYL